MDRQPARSPLFYTAVLAVALIVPTAVAVLTGAFFYASGERTRLEEATDDVNKDVLNRIEHELAARVAMLQALATSPALDQGDIATFEGQARSVVALEGTSIVLQDALGRTLVDTRLAAGDAPPAHPQLRDAHEALRRTWKPYISDLFDDPVTGRMTVMVDVPVIRRGAIVYFLSASIDPPFLARLLPEDIDRGGPFQSAIIDRRGVVVAHSTRNERVGNTVGRIASQEERGKAPRTTIGNEVVYLVWRRALASDWEVRTSLDEATLTAPRQLSLKIFAGVVGALLIFVPGIAFWITREQEYAVTKAKRELELRVEERTLELADKTTLTETILEAMEQGVLATNQAGQLVAINRRARELLDLDEVLGSAHLLRAEVIRHLQRRGEYDHAPPDLVDQITSGLGPLEPYERRRPNGKIIEVRSAALPSGGVVKTLTDVTDLRRHAAELQSAREAAEQANRAKTDFLATMSHEVRTPLNSVIGYADLLATDAALGESQRRKAERIRSSGATLLAMIDDVLDFAKIEAGAIDIRLEPFYLQALVADTMSLVRPAALVKQLQLEAETIGAIPRRLIGDQSRLAQVLLNLLSNAIKFTPQGGVFLTIDGRPVSSEAWSLRFEIRDTGIGVPADNQDRLFQRFVQADDSIAPRFGGTGLGLAICKHLVERMGGQIGFRDSNGIGAIVWFSLVLAVAAPEELRAEPDVTLVPGELSARVLVAEDVPINQDLARELLESAGHVVDVVATGEEAIKQVQEKHYDLVLMDWYMPGLDGLAATRLIRGLDHPARTIPIVACSANVLPAQVAQFRQAGVDGFIAKPLKRTELQALVQQFAANASGVAVKAPAAADDEANFEHIIELLGPSKVRSALARLQCDLEAVLAAEAFASRESAVISAKKVHELISTASLFGLTRLGELCRQLEHSLDDDSERSQLLEQLRALTASTFDQLRLLSDCLKPDDKKKCL